MKLSGDFTTFWLAIVVALFLFQDGLPFHRTSEVHYAYCFGADLVGKCQKVTETGPINSYRPDRDHNTVAYWSDNNWPSVYANCVIRDADNWSCEQGQGNQHMLNGTLYLNDSATPLPSTLHQVERWRWWLQRAREMTSTRTNTAYMQTIGDRIKSHTRFTPAQIVQGNPEVQFAVELQPDGTISRLRKLRTSGIPGFDDAVAKAIEESQPFSADTTGKVPMAFMVAHHFLD